MTLIVLPIGRGPTRLQVAKDLYVRGRIDLDEFERRVDVLMRGGEADEPGIADMVNEVTLPRPATPDPGKAQRY